MGCPRLASSVVISYGSRQNCCVMCVNLCMVCFATTGCLCVSWTIFHEVFLYKRGAAMDDGGDAWCSGRRFRRRKEPASSDHTTVAHRALSRLCLSC